MYDNKLSISFGRDDHGLILQLSGSEFGVGSPVPPRARCDYAESLDPGHVIQAF